MPEFTYEAMGSSGTRTQGTLVAGSEREVMAMLDARGLFPVQIAAKKALATGKIGGRVSSRHLATFYSQLADLLHSGVPLLRSLDILERQGSSQVLAAKWSAKYGRRFGRHRAGRVDGAAPARLQRTVRQYDSCRPGRWIP